jgi:hypothetical protein
MLNQRFHDESFELHQQQSWIESIMRGLPSDPSLVQQANANNLSQFLESEDFNDAVQATLIENQFAFDSWRCPMLGRLGGRPVPVVLANAPPSPTRRTSTPTSARCPVSAHQSLQGFTFRALWTRRTSTPTSARCPVSAHQSLQGFTFRALCRRIRIRDIYVASVSGWPRGGHPLGWCSHPRHLCGVGVGMAAWGSSPGVVRPLTSADIMARPRGGVRGRRSTIAESAETSLMPPHTSALPTGCRSSWCSHDQGRRCQKPRNVAPRG